MGITDHIYQDLKKRLENGNYPAGTRFPSESTLADEFSVNKMTMNKIVSMLAEQGYLIRGNRGAGNPAWRKTEHDSGALLAFLGQLKPYSTRILAE